MQKSLFYLAPCNAHWTAKTSIFGLSGIVRGVAALSGNARQRRKAFRQFKLNGRTRDHF